MIYKRELVKARLHIPFPHAFSALRFWSTLVGSFTYFYGNVETNVITSKTQRNGENACVNGMANRLNLESKIFFLIRMLIMFKIKINW